MLHTSDKYDEQFISIPNKKIPNHSNLNDLVFRNTFIYLIFLHLNFS